MTDTVIPFLPDHLTVIPPAPRSGDDPEADARRAAYLLWRDEMYRYRLERHTVVASDPHLIELERYYCARDFGYWLTMYGTIFEPREDRNSLGGGNLPYIPFAKQIDLANFVFWVLTQRGPNADAAISKARDIGVSWMFCAIALWGWLFRSPWNVLLISRKEDLVDSKNHRSLFAKIDRLRRGLPPWMMPEGFSENDHRMKLFLMNPANGNELAGESTTSNAGRADRATFVGLDEGALIPQLTEVWNGLAATTSHRIVFSSVHLSEGLDFYNLCTGNDMEYRPALFELDWWDNPLNDDVYLANERVRYASRPHDFEREIMRNPHAGVSTWVYGRLWEPKYEPDPLYNEIQAMAATYIAIDPGKLDDTAIVIIQENPATLETVIIDAYQNKGMDADFYGTLLSAKPDHVKYPGAYGPREEEFVELVRDIPSPTYCGDVYGDHAHGATLDTVYSVLLRYQNPQGGQILVNRDRLGNKDRGMYARSRSTFKGRQQSLNELIDGLRFATRPGARFAHKCLTHHRFKPVDDARGLMNEPSTPLHDWTSHVAQACEFYAVYKATRSELLKYLTQPKEENKIGPTRRVQLLGKLATAQRSRLYRPFEEASDVVHVS